MSTADSSRSRNRRIAVSVAALALVLVAAWAVYQLAAGDDSGADLVADAPVASPAPVPDRVTRQLAQGKVAAFVVKPDRPPVPELRFLDASGAERSLKDWQGRVVLLNLWATWCAPCRKEMPELAKLQRELGGEEFEVVALSVDRKGKEASEAFLKEAEATALALYLDTAAEAIGKLGAVGLPATLLIDRKGREIGRLMGPADWAHEDAQRLVGAALREGEPAES